MRHIAISAKVANENARSVSMIIYYICEASRNMHGSGRFGARRPDVTRLGKMA